MSFIKINYRKQNISGLSFWYTIITKLRHLKGFVSYENKIFKKFSSIHPFKCYEWSLMTYCISCEITKILKIQNYWIFKAVAPNKNFGKIHKK